MKFIDPTSHPTLNGRWIGDRPGQTHLELVGEMARAGVWGALAHGLPTVGGYDHRTFFEETIRHKNLLPVGALTDIRSVKDAKADLTTMARVGYSFVKIHPRLLGYEQCLDLLPEIVHAAVGLDLAVLLCTYPEYRSTVAPNLARARMAEAFASEPDGRFMAVHAGVLDPDPFPEVARGNSSMILDFSLSLPKYPEIVLPNVIQLAAEPNISLCVGSDGPEWTYEQLRHSLESVEESSNGLISRRLSSLDLENWLSPVAATWLERLRRDNSST